MNQKADPHRQFSTARAEDEAAALVCMVMFAWATVFLLALIWILT